MTAVPEVGERAVGSSSGAQPSSPPWAVLRARELAGAVLLCALAFSQAGGLLVADTKLDLAIDPGGFLTRALQAWDSQAAFGQVQNQAYGYLWPMGPFFLLGHALGLPAWMVQRLWWCLLLLAAYAGLLLLLRALRVGTPTSRLVASLVFALSPRVLTTLGGISVESWPSALTPWILLPLIMGAGRSSPRRAAALSAVAVACLGGVNATASLVALVPAFLFLVTREKGERRTRLLLWWLPLSAAAIAWWLVPLVLMSRYSYPFLAYIESAATTTAPLSLLDNLRGTNHWVGFLVLDGSPSWPAGWWLSSAPAAVVATTALAALGLLGLLSRGCAERRYLRITLLVGVVVLGAGYAGALGAPTAPWVATALDGWAAPLRNVHKFDVLIRLPLAAGIAVLIPLSRPYLHGVLRRAFVDRDGPTARRASAIGAVALVLLPLGVVASPMLRDDIAQYGSFETVPTPWTDASTWLAGHGSDARTLLLPASNFGEYSWGRPRDEPFQALARSDWGVRNIVPLGAPGATRWLDAVQAVVSRGAPSSTLAPALRAAGVRYVLLRTDLDPSTRVVDPTIVRATLSTSSGLTRVAAFGDPATATASEDGADAVGLVPLPQIEIYEVTGSVDRVTAAPEAALRTFSGGPEAQVSSGLASQPGIWVALADGGAVTGQVVTDTLRRRVMNVGAQRGADYSPTLTPGTPVARGGAAGDISPWPTGTDETALRYIGITDVSSSSSAADPFDGGYLGPAYRAFSATDGLASTRWLASPSDPSPWWRVVFPRRQLTNATLDLVASDEITAVNVATDTGGVRRVLDDADRRGPVTVALPPGSSTTVLVTLEVKKRRTQAVGLAEVRLPGIIAAETVTVSAAVGGGGAVFTRAPGARRQCVPTPDSWACSPVWGQLGEEEVGLDRTFTARESTRLRAEVLVTPQQGAELNGLLDTLSGHRVVGSSQLLDDAVARPGAALDGDPATAWIPGVADLTPRLDVTYAAPLTASTISVSDGLGSDPVFQTVVVAAAGRTFEARLDGGTATFPAVTSASWRIQLRRTTSGTGRIAVPRVNVTLGPDVDRTTGDVAVPCSAGLATIIDGRVERLSVKSNSRDVLLGGTIVADHCTSPVVPITTGTHRLTSSAGGGFEVESVRLLPVTRTVGAAPALPVSVRTWLPEERSVSIPAGGASVVALTEGFNPGWVASVDGVTLEPVRLDGWRQAWRVPSGVGDRAVDMTYAPGRVQRLALAFGLLLLVGVVAAAAVRGPSAAPPSGPGRGRRATATLSAVLVPALVASWVGLLVGALVAGAASRVPPRIRALAGAGSVMLAGVVAAVVGGAWGSGGAAAVVQTLAVIAVAVVAVSGVDDLESGGSSGDMHERRAFDDEP